MHINQGIDQENAYFDPLSTFTDREEILALFQQALHTAQPHKFYLLAVKGNSGTGKTFLAHYLAQHICPKFGYQVGQLQFAQSLPEFRSILWGIENALKNCVPRASIEKHRNKRDECNRRFDNYKASITINQKIEANHQSSILHVNQNVHINTQLHEREIQLRSELSHALIELAEECQHPLCLFIDGYERLAEAASELSGWLWEEVLHNLMHAIPQPFFVITCGWEWPYNATIEPFMQRFELNNFDSKQVKEFLAKPRIISSPSKTTGAEDKELVSAFYELTQGHPLVLGLAASYFNALEVHERTANTLRGNFQHINNEVRVEFIEKRLLERLPEPYRSCLERGPILRSFNQATLQILLNTPIREVTATTVLLDDRAYMRLLSFPFINQYAISNNTTSMLRPTFHELVRRIWLGVLRQHHPSTKKQLDHEIMVYYKKLADDLQESQGKFEAQLEYLYHALQQEKYVMEAFEEWNKLIAEAIDTWQSWRVNSLLDIIQQLEREGEPLLNKTSIYYGRYLIWYSKFLSQEASSQEALTSLEQALQLFEQFDNPIYVAACLNNIGEHLRKQGDFEQAIHNHKRALELRKNDGRPDFIAQSLNNIGIIYEEQGELEKALKYFEQANSLFEQAGIPAEAAAPLNSIGQIYGFKGELEEALKYYKQALAYDEQVYNPAKIASTLNNIGGIYRQLGDLQQALQYHERALMLDEQIGNLIGIASTVDHLGRIYEIMEKFEQALKYYEQALILSKQFSNPFNLADSLDNIGGIYRRQGNLEQALNYHKQALALRERVGNPIYIATSFNNLGTIYYAQNEKIKALQFFKQALALLKQVEYPAGLAACFQNMGKIYCDLGDLEQALKYHKQSLSIRKKLGNPIELASINDSIGLTYSLQRKFETALRYYKQSSAFREQTGNLADTALSYSNLSLIYQQLRMWKSASKYSAKSLSLYELLGSGFEAEIADQLEDLSRCYAQLGITATSAAYKLRAQKIRSDQNCT